MSWDHDPQGLLASERVAIVGVGGTGSHVLDYLSKSPVAEIHLFDGDQFLPRNAKRSPGAINDLGDARPVKAEFHGERYGGVREGIVAHGEHITEHNVHRLAEYTSVFLCIDGGPIKRPILEVCMASHAILINVGMGVFALPGDDRLSGIVGVTACRSEFFDHVQHCFGLDEATEDDHNRQTVELNALNAALAVVKWKKLLGVYADDTQEMDSMYVIAENCIDNAFPMAS